MRALVYSDLQATEGHERLHCDPTRPLQRERVAAFYEILKSLYERHKCDCLWDLGDTLDDRSSIPVPTIDTVCAGLSQFPAAQWNIKLVGNHEQFVRSTELHSGKLFSPYFAVVDTNQAYSTGEGVRILACSYPANDADTVAWIREQRKQVKKTKEKVILLGHFQAVGCMTNSGQLMTGIPKEELAWVNLGLLGHIHKPQTLTGNVHYIGSPFQQDWGEAEEGKRVAIVDTSSLTIEWVPIEGFPRYLQVGLKEFKELATAESEDRFKVQLRSQDEATEFYAHQFAHWADPIYDFDVAASNTSEDSAQMDGSAWSFDNIIKRYVERYTPESKGVPATVQEMIDYGKEMVAH